MSKITKIKINYNDYKEIGNCILKYSSDLIENIKHIERDKEVYIVFTDDGKRHVIPLNSVRNIIEYYSEEE